MERIDLSKTLDGQGEIEQGLQFDGNGRSIYHSSVKCDAIDASGFGTWFDEDGAIIRAFGSSLIGDGEPRDTPIHRRTKWVR